MAILREGIVGVAGQAKADVCRSTADVACRARTGAGCYRTGRGGDGTSRT